MADIDLTRIHNLGLKAARVKAERMADQLGRKFDLKGDWEGNTLKFERPGVSGSLAITDKDLRLLVTLGFLFKAMRGSIESAVKHELDSLFAQTATKPVEKVPAKAKKDPPPRKKGG